MKAELAKNRAAEWVMENVSKETWYRGAYFSGSIIDMPSGAELASSSDVDVVIVTSEEEAPLKLGKFVYRNVLLEITYLSWNLFTSTEEVLTSYHLAGSFRVNTIIDDPTGHLHTLQKDVAKHFTEVDWVRRRCENAKQKIENGVRNFNPIASWHDQVTSWLFPTGITTHVLLVAALRNPTVRKRYLAARKVLEEYDYKEFYSELLELLGCRHLSPKRVEEHLDELANTFDVAASVAKTPFFFSTDITHESRPIAIDGSRDLIRAGFHHEAIFWIVATFARCHKILEADANPELQQEHLPAFNAIVADLGITSTEDLQNRGKKLQQFLPRLWEMTEIILLANPKINQ